jgi:hypothetical protein
LVAYATERSLVGLIVRKEILEVHVEAGYWSSLVLLLLLVAKEAACVPCSITLHISV